MTESKIILLIFRNYGFCFGRKPEYTGRAKTSPDCPPKGENFSINPCIFARFQANFFLLIGSSSLVEFCSITTEVFLLRSGSIQNEKSAFREKN